MPKIKIHEKDNTGTPSLGEISNVVYVPGKAIVNVEPKLFTTAKDFDKAFTDGTGYIEDLSAKMAHHLLKIGMHVCYEGFKVESASSTSINNNEFTIDEIEYTINDNTVSWGTGKEATIDAMGIVTLEGGLVAQVKVTDEEVDYPMVLSEGATNIVAGKFTINAVEFTLGDNTVTDGNDTYSVTNGEVVLPENILAKIDYVHNLVNYTVAVASNDELTISDSSWERLQDKALYDVRFLTTGGYWCPTTSMVTCAAMRCDAVALVDTKKLDPAEVRAEVEPIISAATSTASSSTLDATTFASVFVPTLEMSVIGINDVVSIEEVPASFGYLCAFANSVQSNPVWYAVAGSFRGIIPNLISVKREYTTSDIEMLQARAKNSEVALDDAGDNVGMAINPIAYVRPFGHIVWGNRTARNNPVDGDGTGAMKATSFLNCRILSTEVAKTAYNAARRYTFEQNSEVLWANFTSQILPLLDRMETGNGILDYKITRVATNKKARLAAKISLVPIEAVEDFDILIELADSISVTE